MDNHIHLIVVPDEPTSLARMLRDVQTKHVVAMNAEHGWEGHLWHGRYFSCALGEDHLREAVRYVERNPVRARLVADARAYAWSSAQAHCGLRADAVLSPDLPLLRWVDDWGSFLEDEGDPVAVERVRFATARGILCSAHATQAVAQRGNV
ncbi:MAG: transposase [Armatimonadetes bacterium]|nr:transposase [Armatimonadota bacterium]